MIRAPDVAVMQLATLVYVRQGGRTLMLHRIKKPNDMHAGKWNGLGGKLEPGETPEACAIREVYEESGLRIARPTLRGIITFPQFSRGVDWYTFIFVAREFSGELIESSEGVLAWVEDARLPELNLWAGDAIFLRWLDLDGFFSAKFVYHAGELTNYEVVFYTPEAGPEPMSVQTGASRTFRPVYRPEDDERCWLCGGATIKRHCKIICQVCGFTRDCSDP
ncbi:MAG TPA: 8-oxo-dGTP diphosphatase [Caldilineaceae bacterium]|nr:8-oxo-dGTP diphosphatase [Caldilineaceae bacterium]